MKLKFQNISTALLFLLGIFWTVFASVIYAKYTKVTEADTYFQFILIIGMVFGCLLTIWSILGMAATFKQPYSILGAYNVANFIFLSVSIATLVISLLSYYEVEEYKNDTNCSKDTTFIRLFELNNISYQTLCQSNCQCYFQGDQIQAKQQEITNFSQKESDPINVQECEAFQNFNLEDQDLNTELLKSLEEAFECSGFCSKNSYYVFSNVNQGIPNKDCRDEIINYLHDNTIKTIISSSVITFIFAILFGFSLFFSLKKTNDYESELNANSMLHKNDRDKFILKNYFIFKQTFY
ncbi:hypothetical protein ABPG72_007383 [Tetrahymena utriculariae]